MELFLSMGFPSGSVVKNLPTMWELQATWVQSLGWEDLLEESAATHSNILAWKSKATVHRIAKGQTWLKRFTCLAHIAC